MIKKSLAENAVLNLVRTVMSIAFPLITFPYASRVLLADNLGKVNFSNSIISYFVLLAGLGIKTYAIREGARLRNNKKQLEMFSCEVFTINIYSTVISYILLVLFYFFSQKLQDYQMLLIVQSFNIIGTTVGVEWLYVIYEDYKYITIRSIAVQAVSMVLLFLFVHSSDDYIIYSCISTFSASAGFLINYIHSRSLIHLKVVSVKNCGTHIKPILVIFIMTVATTIYVNSDITMLGYINGDYYVGLYNVSTKIYGILKNLMAAIIIVALPRLSNALAEKEITEYNQEASSIFDHFIVLLAPVVLGAFLCSREIVLLISGEAYVEAISAFKILTISLLFSVFSIYLTNVILLPQKKEKTLMFSTICSALVNLLLNFFLLPKYKHIGAAFTTLIAEVIIFAWQFASIKFSFPFDISKKKILCILFGCMLIVVSNILIDLISINSIYLSLILRIFSSILLYSVVLIAGHYPTADIIMRKVMKVMTRKHM